MSLSMNQLLNVNWNSHTLSSLQFYFVGLVFSLLEIMSTIKKRNIRYHARSLRSDSTIDRFHDDQITEIEDPNTCQKPFLGALDIIGWFRKVLTVKIAAVRKRDLQFLGFILWM